MSDVLFRYLLAARRRDRSIWRHLIYTDEPWLEAGVEQLVETAAARVEVTSQHERRSLESVRAPTSHPRPSRFHDAQSPKRPAEGHFEERSAELPVRGTYEVTRCRRCQGTGELECSRCHGIGVASCETCGGAGSTRHFTCEACAGSCVEDCRTCRGEKQVSCTRCRGHGSWASWNVERYSWLIERRSGKELPELPVPDRLRRALDEWLEHDRLNSAEPAAAVQPLGFETPEALEVAARVEKLRHHLEDEASRSEDRCLFHRTDVWFTPVGYAVLRLAGEARVFLLIGRGEQAREVMPRARLHRAKCLGWLGLGFLGLNSFDALQTHNLLLPLLERGRQFTHAYEQSLAALTVLSGALIFLVGLLAITGVVRVLRTRKEVRTIGLISASGRPTAFLTCLAYLGSYLGHFRVLDRAYDLQAERMRGDELPDRQSRSLSLHLPNGRKLRLVEVANAHRLSEGQLRRMARALDGVMFLELPDDTTEDLRTRISAAAEAPPRIGSVTIDDRGRDPSASGDALPLEAVRRAFVEDLGDVDWQALFDRMWWPIEELLDPPGKRRR